MLKEPGWLHRFMDKSGHSYLRLALLVTIPALFWIGIFGLLGAWRLGTVEDIQVVMAYPQALIFLIASLILLTARLFPRTRALCAGAALVLAAAVLLLGQWWPQWRAQRLGLPDLGGLLLAFSGLAMLVAKPVRGPLAYRPGRDAIITTIIGTFFSVGAAYVLIERDVHYIQGVAQVRAEHLRDEMMHSAQSTVGEIQRLGERWSYIDHDVPKAFVEHEFSSLLRNFDEFKRITYLDEKLQPLHDKVADPKYFGALERALMNQAFREGLRQTLQGPISGLMPAKASDLDSQVGFIATAVYRGKDLQRLVVATVDLEELLDDDYPDDEDFSCCFRIRSKSGLMLEKPVQPGERVLATASTDIPVHPELVMSLDYWHTDDSQPLMQPFLPEAVLMFGLVFTFLANGSQRLAHVVKRRNQQLQYRSLHDDLTGLPNRRMLVESMEAARQACSRSGDSLSVIFLEVDGLRLISDSLGHEVSDSLLVLCARRLQAVLPTNAWLSRLDAGDFVVCVTSMSREELEQLASQLIEAIQEPFEIESHLLRLSAFAGITRSTPPMDEPMQLVRQADLAMLEARRRGQNNWYHYRPELGEKVQARLTHFNELQQAIEKGQIQLYYQPIVDSRTGAIKSLEVLMRQPHPVQGFIPPSVFIPMAEESGQIMPLTDWLLRRVSQDARHLEEAGFGHIPLAVNISTRYFQTADFVEKVRSALIENGIQGKRLQLEITESVLMEDPASVVFKLQQLRSLGIECGLDDFGTGYSSMAYLRDLPISLVKIDRIFVKNVISEPSDAAIVRAVCSLAHHMHLKVVVEGVESAAQISFLRHAGCDLFQGYYFDRPKPLTEIIDRFREFGDIRDIPPMVEGGDAVLLVGDRAWASLLAPRLKPEGMTIHAASTSANVFTFLAQNKCKVMIVQGEVPGILVGDLLKRVADIYPEVRRWLYLESETSLDMGYAALVRQSHKVWTGEDSIQSMARELESIRHTAL